MTCDYLKHRIFDFTQVAFWVGQEEVYESPDDWRPLKTSLSRHHQGRILGLSLGRKRHLIAIMQLELSLYRSEKIEISVGQVQKMTSK